MKVASSIIRNHTELQNNKTFTETVRDLGLRAKLRNKEHGKVSVLMCKGYQEMASFSIDAVVEEMVTLFPELCLLLRAMMSSPQADDTELSQITPRVGMIYVIIMQTRNHELSLMQRMLSMILSDNLCDQKVSIYLKL